MGFISDNGGYGIPSQGLGSNSGSGQGTTVRQAWTKAYNPQQYANETYGGPVTLPQTGDLYQQYLQEQAAMNAGSNIYGPQLADINSQLASGAQNYALSNQASALNQAQSSALADQVKKYLGQEVGFANQDADLARQMLGYDRESLGVNRADYQRQWDFDKFNQYNDAAARGSVVSGGQRTKEQNMAEQLWNAMHNFGIEGKRLDNQGNQIDLNLQQQLANYANQGANANIGSMYGNQGSALEQAMAAAGYYQSTAGLTAQQAALEAQMKWLQDQAMAGLYGAPSGGGSGYYVPPASAGTSGSGRNSYNP